MMQRDRYSLCKTLLATELTTGSNLFTYHTAAVVERGHIPLQALMLAKMSAQAIGMIGTENPWPMTMVRKTEGCY